MPVTIYPTTLKYKTTNGTFESATAIKGDSYTLTATDKEEIAQQAAVSLAPTLDEKAPVIYCEASGAIASFTDGGDDLPIQDLVVQIEPVQAGSGDPSPDNVRAISGWTGAKVTRTGKNLLANKKVLAGNNIIFGADVIGSPSSSDTHSITLPAGTYTLSVETADGSNTYLYAAKVGDTQYFERATNAKSVTFTLSETTDCRLWAYKNVYSTVGVGAITQFQLELGSTATDYEPYQGETYDITFPSEAGTVYGGSLDVTTGVLTVDRAQIASYAGETLPSTWISDRDVYSAGATPTTGAQVVYELATPQTYQLTPTEIRTLLGQNNTWVDTGDTTVIYRADTKLYIQQLTKPTAADVGAIAAPASPATGAFLVWSGNAWTAQTLATWEGGSF